MAMQKRRWKTRDGRLIAWTAAESAPLLPDYLPSGLVRYGAPTGMHDDYVMSLALAWSGVFAGELFWAI